MSNLENFDIYMPKCSILETINITYLTFWYSRCNKYIICHDIQNSWNFLEFPGIRAYLEISWEMSGFLRIREISFKVETLNAMQSIVLISHTLITTPKISMYAILIFIIFL